MPQSKAGELTDMEIQVLGIIVRAGDTGITTKDCARKAKTRFGRSISRSYVHHITRCLGDSGLVSISTPHQRGVNGRPSNVIKATADGVNTVRELIDAD